jgi:NTE family protein
MQKTVNLILSGGGARGDVHIGVIEVLLEKGYKINSISGSSMGALIGAMLACGKLEEYKNWACDCIKIK